jgi:phosphoserine / homoserine phosphotransferase
MDIVCLDLEGVLVPEIWIAFSEATGIPELRITTRDEPDYGKLMRYRIGILESHGLKLVDIQRTIGAMEPLGGAKEFVAELRALTQFVILSDTFSQFAGPLMAKLGYPTLFCNSLVVDPSGRIVDYALRQENGKMKSVAALKSLNFRVFAAGDSYNDLAMIREADGGALFRAPEGIKAKCGDLPMTETFGELLGAIKDFLGVRA